MCASCRQAHAKEEVHGLPGQGWRGTPCVGWQHQAAAIRSRVLRHSVESRVVQGDQLLIHCLPSHTCPRPPASSVGWSAPRARALFRPHLLHPVVSRQPPAATNTHAICVFFFLHSPPHKSLHFLYININLFLKKKWTTHARIACSHQVFINKEGVRGISTIPEKNKMRCTVCHQSGGGVVGCNYHDAITELVPDPPAAYPVCPILMHLSCARAQGW